MIRVIVSVGLFWLLYILRPSSAIIQRKDVVLFVICGATGVAVNQLLFIKGLTLTTPIHAALLMLACPVFITFIDTVLAKEKIGFIKILVLY